MPDPMMNDPDAAEDEKGQPYRPRRHNDHHLSSTESVEHHGDHHRSHLHKHRKAHTNDQMNPTDNDDAMTENLNTFEEDGTLEAVSEESRSVGQVNVKGRRSHRVHDISHEKIYGANTEIPETPTGGRSPPLLDTSTFVASELAPTSVSQSICDPTRKASLDGAGIGPGSLLDDCCPVPTSQTDDLADLSKQKAGLEDKSTGALNRVSYEIFPVSIEQPEPEKPNGAHSAGHHQEVEQQSHDTSLQEHPNDVLPVISEHNDDILVIPEAFLVDFPDVPNAEVSMIPSAEVVAPDKYSVTIGGKKFHIGILLLATAVLVAVVALSVFFSVRKGNSTFEVSSISPSISYAPSTFPTMMPTISDVPSTAPTTQTRQKITDKIESVALRRNVSFSTLSQEDSRNLALNWIITDDAKQLGVDDANLIQRYLLALMDFGFGQKLSLNYNWLSSLDECNWYGVSCVDSEVESLALGKMRRCKLTQVSSALFKSFAFCFLSDECNLTGTLPAEIAGLDKIKSVLMNGNFLTGTLPPELGKLQLLEELWLNNNLLTGTLSPEFGNLSALSDFVLYGNQLTGTIPPELGNLNGLTQFYLSENYFTKMLPSSLRNLLALKTCDLSANQFTGSLPSWLGDLTTLEVLTLYDNQFNGTLPSVLGHLKSLTYLDLKENELIGTLPSELGAIKYLTYLDLSNNKFTGTLPSQLGNLKALRKTLWLCNNQLSGTVPSSLGKLTTLGELCLENNELTGTLPSSLCNLTELENLYLSGNEFTGKFPCEAETFKKLGNFCLSDNFFTGTLPNEMGMNC